jgi:hypothetical protein
MFAPRNNVACIKNTMLSCGWIASADVSSVRDWCSGRIGQGLHNRKKTQA